MRLCLAVYAVPVGGHGWTMLVMACVVVWWWSPVVVMTLVALVLSMVVTVDM